MEVLAKISATGLTAPVPQTIQELVVNMSMMLAQKELAKMEQHVLTKERDTSVSALMDTKERTAK